MNMTARFFHKKRILSLACILPVLGSVAGCGASSAELPTEITELAMPVPAASASVDYEVPVQIPNTLVDQVGYNASAEKAACTMLRPVSWHFPERS